MAAGPAALLLQLAHPLVAAAVAGHSGFRADPFQRLRSTLEATLLVTFGDRAQAANAAARVAATHRGVRGRLPSPCGRFPAGSVYSAVDRSLALWVHATLVMTALAAFERFVSPLTPDARERYYQEAKRFGSMFGVTHDIVPETYAEFERYVLSMQEETLYVCRAARELAEDILSPPNAGVLGVMTVPMTILTAGLLPPGIRMAYRLAWGGQQRVLFGAGSLLLRAAARTAPSRVRFWPHYQVARRRAALD